MKRTMKRQAQCRQIDLVSLHLTIADVAGVPTAGGIDVAFVKEVEDLGAGLCKIVFYDKAQRNIVPVSILSATQGLVGRTVASDKESITVQLEDFDGVATDGDFSLHCLYHEARTLY